MIEEECLTTRLDDLAFQGGVNGLSTEEIVAKIGLSRWLGHHVGNAVVERVLLTLCTGGATEEVAARGVPLRWAIVESDTRIHPARISEDASTYLQTAAAARDNSVTHPTELR